MYKTENTLIKDSEKKWHQLLLEITISSCQHLHNIAYCENKLY